MRTELSWTEFRRGLADLRALIAFRSGAMGEQNRRRLRIAGLVLGLITLGTVLIPAFLRGPLEDRNVGALAAISPTLYLGFLVLAVFASIASGGGREVVPREELVAYPVSAVTEHFGALLLAPVNIAWILQTWTLIGITSYVLGPVWMPASLLPVVLWIVTATALGQGIGWWVEGIRRARHGVLIVRTLGVAATAGTVALVASDRLSAILDRSPLLWIFLAGNDAAKGRWLGWALPVLALLALLVAAVIVGTVPARWALLRPARDELRVESGYREARRDPGGPLRAQLRIDRAAVWRSVPLRRGLLVLALMPGAVAVAGDLTWDLVTVLPGLVASGAALLFGVNAWALDGRGALWRESLPAPPWHGFVSKMVVLYEVLLIAAGLTLLLSGLAAGIPTPGEASAVIAATAVVATQVVAAALRWSVNRPFTVDLRSARATPAPPVVMAGYSARLALSTTMTALVFSGAAQVDDWRLSVLLAIPMLLWSGVRLLRTGRAWVVPEVRGRVVAVVAS